MRHAGLIIAILAALFPPACKAPAPTPPAARAPAATSLPTPTDADIGKTAQSSAAALVSLLAQSTEG